MAAFGIVVLMLAAAAAAQVQPIAELPLTLDGQVNVGYMRSSNDTNAADGVYFGTSAALNGYYHDPRFLKFDLSPTYRYDHNGNDVVAATGDNREGIHSSLDFLGGSSMPLTFRWNFFRNNTATVDGGLVPVTVSADGITDDFQVGWSLRKRKLPTLTLGYSWGSSSTSVTGVNAPDISNDHSGLNALANYSVLGFRLWGSYTRQISHQFTPDLLNLGIPQTTGNTRQSGEQVGISRNLPLHTTADMRVAHNHSQYDVFGSPQNQQYDTVNTMIASLPTKRLNLNFTGNYSSNAAAQTISDLLAPGNVAAGAVPPAQLFQSVGRSLSYTGAGTYDLGRGFYLQAVGGHQRSRLSGSAEVLSDDISVGLFHQRRLKGGIFSVNYAPGYDRIRAPQVPFSARALAQVGGVGYVRRVGRWTAQGNFRYSQSDVAQTLTIPIASRSIVADGKATTKLMHRWNLSLQALLNRMSVAGSNGSFNKMFSGTLANRTWSFTVQEQLTSGYSVLTAGGLTTVNPIEAGLFPNTLYANSSGLSLSGAYNRRYLSVVTVYGRVGSDLDALLGPVHAGNSNVDTRVVYKLRKIEIRGGFRWWSQMATNNGGLTSRQRTFWFDIVRPFRLF